MPTLTGEASVVGELPVRQRVAVDCFYFADLSVKSTLSDARARLRTLLEVSE